MLIKTDKGRLELQPGQRTLGQRERAILLVADGRKPTASLHALFQGEGRAVVETLLAGGYLAEDRPVAPLGAADSFSGPRSLASARMFLFDLSERMFAPRDRAFADRLREALREARDADTMLVVGREMLAEIERSAGTERAQAIGERLARVLPEAMAARA
jgi:hypothetical protein